MYRSVELLAPAGNMEALIAAVANGANAVYLGGKKFGARASSANFSNEEIINAINYAHIRDVKIYVTMNTLIFNDEVRSFMEYINFLYKNQVDAVIVQDLGMLELIRRNFPDLEIHCSTQMNAVNSLDVNYLENLGVTRVVLARENTSDDVKKIKEKSNVELEVFVHGALCMAYSGKCLFASVEGNRSGNRGECSQLCRMKYSLNSSKTSSEMSYLLSTKDLSTITNIKELLNIPFDSFKLEGRMKRPEYVAQVVAAYREAIDNFESISQSRLLELENRIKHIFNREYTKGYLLGDQGFLISNTDSPKNIGIFAGIVLENNSRKKRLKIRLEEDLNVGDGLSTGEFVGRILIGNKILKSACAGDVIELDYIGNCRVGDKIYKTYCKEIMDLAVKSSQNEFREYDLSARFEMKIGEYPRLTFSDEKNSVTVLGDSLVQEAIKTPILDEKIANQLGKLGDSIYKLNDIEIDRDKNSIVPVSAINALRRDAVQILLDKRTKIYDRKEKIVNFDINNDFNYENDRVSIGVYCKTLDQLKACKDENIDRIIVDNESIYENARSLFEESGIYYKLPYVTREGELEDTIKQIDKLGENFIVSSVGLLEYLKDKTTVAHYLLNSTNEYSLGAIQSNFVMPSIELLSTRRENDILDTEFFDKIEIPIYYRPILMVTEYCPFKGSNGKCTQNHCEAVISHLENQKGNKYNLTVDANCKILVLGEVTNWDNLLEGFLRTGVNRFNIELQQGTIKESYEETREIIQKYKNLLL